MRNLLLAPFVILLGAASIAASAPRLGAALPGPVDVPAGPPSVGAPEDQALPSIAAGVPSDAPAISMISDATLPDETLVVTGERLDGAHLQLWAAGRMFELEPLRSAADRMQAVVPEQCPAATMLVWPVRDGQAGRPIRVNGATAWWAWPPRAAAGASGQAVRISART